MFGRDYSSGDSNIAPRRFCQTAQAISEVSVAREADEAIAMRQRSCIGLDLSQSSGNRISLDWKYRSVKFGCLRFPAFASGPFQLRLLGVITSCRPGMFAGLMGLGGGCLGNPVPVNNALIANYASSAIIGFAAGPICGKIGFRLSLMLAAAAFALYSASLVIYKQTQAG